MFPVDGLCLEGTVEPATLAVWLAGSAKFWRGLVAARLGQGPEMVALAHRGTQVAARRHLQRRLEPRVSSLFSQRLCAQGGHHGDDQPDHLAVRR